MQLFYCTTTRKNLICVLLSTNKTSRHSLNKYRRILYTLFLTPGALLNRVLSILDILIKTDLRISIFVEKYLRNTNALSTRVL